MSEELNLKTIQTINPSPFKHLCVTIGELPSSFIESMSYYEALAWFVDYLQKTVIPAVNANGEATAELQEKFIELKTFVDTYFDNLDVQEEINNKLDEMAEAGTLQEIISEYLNSTAMWGFDNVAGLKISTNLTNGSYARTLGYYNKNDGGSATYKIRTITNDDVVDECNIIELADDTLIAELIKPTFVTPEMYGCYGDDNHDDSDNFQLMLNSYKDIRLTEGKTYKITKRITVPNNIKIIGNGYNTKIKSYINNGDATFYSTDNVQHFDIENFYFDAANNNNIGFEFSNPYDQCIFKNIYFDNFVNSALKLGNSSSISQTLLVSNCIVYMSGSVAPIAPIFDMVKTYESNIENNKLLFRSEQVSNQPCLRLTNVYDNFIRGNSFANSSECGILITGNCRQNSIISNTYELLSGDYSIKLIGINTDDIQFTLIVQPYTYYSAPNKIYCEKETNGTFIGMASEGGRRNIVLNVNDANVTTSEGNVNLTEEQRCLSSSGFMIQNYNGAGRFRIWSDTSASADNGLKIADRLHTDADVTLKNGVLSIQKPKGKICLKSPDGNTLKYLGINNAGELYLANYSYE